MKNKLMKKTMAILMLLVTLLSVIINNISFASTEISQAKITLRGRCGEHIRLKENGSPISGSYVEYEENGVKYPAYCLDRDLPGVRHTR